LHFLNYVAFLQPVQFAYNDYADPPFNDILTSSPTHPNKVLIIAAPAPRAPDSFAIELVGAIAGLAALALMVLFNACRRSRGTTLFAPLAWGLVSFVLIVLAGISLRPGLPGNSLNTRTTWWLVVATLSCCPTVSLLGAKRPQNRPWQLIVFSLWGILALPAVQNLILHPSDPPSVHVLWRWFYVALIFIGPFNYLATLFAPAGILAAIGQAMLLWQFLPGVAAETSEAPTLGILVTAGSILCAAVLGSRRRRRLTRHGKAEGWNRVWLDFRDSYGVIWGVRVMERIESLLQSSNSPAWLEWWSGFEAPSVTSDLELRQAITANEPGLRNLLRRFVSNDWIGLRLHEGKAPQPHPLDQSPLDA
jgi:hypothetical protein